MPIQFDNFDQQKIDRLKNHLTAMAAKGKAKHYEIYVDALKAVPRTDEPNEFDGYEDYLTPDSEQVKIIIYNTALSPRNDQYVFVLKARNREEAVSQGLNALPITSFSSKSSISEWRESLSKKEAQNQEILALKRENAELRRELEETEEYADQLAAAVEAAKENANKIGGVHWGDVLSVAFEGLVRRNTHLIAQIPGASGLAGLIEKDNGKPAELPQETSEVTFKKKESSIGKDITPEEKEFVALFHQLKKLFNEDEIGQVIGLLDAFSNDKNLLNEVIEYIEREPEQESKGEKTE